MTLNFENEEVYERIYQNSRHNINQTEYQNKTFTPGRNKTPEAHVEKNELLNKTKNSSRLIHFKVCTFFSDWTNKKLYIYIYFFIIQRVKARAIPCPHQPPTRGDNSFGSSRRYCHSWHYQAAFATGQGIKRIIYIYVYIYIYIPQFN